MYAPVALFVYNRPAHTRATVEALLGNRLAGLTDLHVFSDAPKKPEAQQGVDEVRSFLKTISGFKSVTVVERPSNLGLANSIVDGVGALCARHGRVIVLEDDLVTSPVFLDYMNDALGRYAAHPRVYSISGYSFTTDSAQTDSTYFLPITSSWGWATWADKWSAFERDADKLQQSLASPAFIRKFDFNDSYPFSGLARRQLSGGSDSWAIYWYFCVLLRDGLTLFPAKSLVQNVGFDGSGTHGDAAGNEERLVSFVPQLQDDVAEHAETTRLVQQILRKSNRVHLNNRSLKRFAGRVINSIRWRLPNYRRIKLEQTVENYRSIGYRRSVDKSSYVDPSVQVLGWKSVLIGKSTSIGEASWLNVNHRSGDSKQIVIGDNCWIGRNNFFSPGALIELGDYCMTGANCSFLSADHVFRDPLVPYLMTGVTSNKKIRIGSNVWLGSSVTVVGEVSIGRGSVVGANSLVNKDIPPFSIAIGSPCRVHKRYDFIEKAWVSVDDYCAERDAEMPNEEDYLKLLRASHPTINMPLQASSRAFGDMV